VMLLRKILIYKGACVKGISVDKTYILLSRKLREIWLVKMAYTVSVLK
jgi:hypothetical protein